MCSDLTNNQNYQRDLYSDQKIASNYGLKYEM